MQGGIGMSVYLDSELQKPTHLAGEPAGHIEEVQGLGFLQEQDGLISWAK